MSDEEEDEAAIIRQAQAAARARQDEGSARSSEKKQRLGPWGRTPPRPATSEPPSCSSACNCALPSFLPGSQVVPTRETDAMNASLASPLPLPPSSPPASDEANLPASEEANQNHGLNRKQLQRLAAVQHQIAEGLPGGLPAHPFQVLQRHGSWLVQCNVCNNEPTAAGEDEHFLKNFWGHHLNRPRHLANVRRALLTDRTNGAAAEQAARSMYTIGAHALAVCKRPGLNRARAGLGVREFWLDLYVHAGRARRWDRSARRASRCWGCS